jgi:hypothetical protein
VPEEHPTGEHSVNYASSHETECWSCGKKGHKKYNCPKLLKKEKKEKQEKKKNDLKRKEKLRVGGHRDPAGIGKFSQLDE